MILLPEQPDFAGAVGEEILAGEADGDGETLCALADEHDVAGVLHDGLGDHGNILDVANGADRTGAARGTVHAAGIEFDDTFLVGQATEADAGVVGIILGTFDDADGRVERVAAGLEVGEGIVEIVEAVVGGDEDGTLGGP